MTKTIRICIFPFIALFEIFLLFCGWIFAVTYPPAAQKIVHLADKLPDLKWYINP